MADNNNNGIGGILGGPSLIEEGIAVFIILFIAFQVLNQAPQFLERQFGVEITDPQSFYTRTPVSVEAPIGMPVINAEATQVYQTAEGAVKGTQPINAKGRLTDGPKRAGGRYWWEVDYADGPIGWVPAEVLLRSPPFANAPALASALKTIATILSLLMLAGIVYNIIRVTQIRKEEQEELQQLTQEALGSTGGEKNVRWQHIQDHIESANENDWRTAIMEADIMLDEMLDAMGYDGETVGDKLKAVERSDFNTLDKAWEAHKVRNKIAHEGQEYSLTQREAQRVIGLYEDVFSEFSFI